jgi:hypothetical protein
MSSSMTLHAETAMMTDHPYNSQYAAGAQRSDMHVQNSGPAVTAELVDSRTVKATPASSKTTL